MTRVVVSSGQRGSSMKTDVPDLSEYPQNRPQTHYATHENWYLHADWNDNDGNPHIGADPKPKHQLICYSRRVEFWDRYMRDLTGDRYAE